jgi:hypothetical protein
MADVPEKLFDRVCRESGRQERELIKACFVAAAVAFVAGIYVGWFVISPWF